MLYVYFAAARRTSAVFFPGFMPQRLGLWLVKLAFGVTQHTNVLSGVLNCIYFNARSLCNKLTFLNALLSSTIYNKVFDLIFVSETWFNDEKITDGLIINGLNNYCVLRKDRHNTTRGGGVSIIFNSELKFYLVQYHRNF